MTSTMELWFENPEELGKEFALKVEQRKRKEWKLGYPTATPEQIEMLMAADEKNGSPPHSLEHAKTILAQD